MTPDLDRPAVDLTGIDFALGTGLEHRDVHRLLADLRRSAPYARVAYAGREAVLLLTHELVSAAFRDDATFPAAAVYPLTTGPVLGHTVQCMSGDEHRRNRTILSAPLRRRRVEEVLRPLVDRTALDVVDGFADRGHADLVEEFTTVFPVVLISRMLGLPVDALDDVRRWARDLFHFTIDPEAALRASREFTAFATPIVAARRRDPGDDLVSVLAHSRLDDSGTDPATPTSDVAGASGDRALDDEEILSFLRLLFPAGSDTTMLAIGNTVAALLTHPDQLALVRADPDEHAPWAVWEGLRFEPPVGLLPRLCPNAVRWNGIEFAANTPVIFAVTAANRDPAVYPHPDRFDIRRRVRPLVSFGQGPHSCAGNWVALAAVESAVRSLVSRLPDLRLAEDADPQVGGRVAAALRGPARLDVEWTVRA